MAFTDSLISGPIPAWNRRVMSRNASKSLLTVSRNQSDRVFALQHHLRCIYRPLERCTKDSRSRLSDQRRRLLEQQKRSDGKPEGCMSYMLHCSCHATHPGGLDCDPRTASEGTRCKHFCAVGGRRRGKVVKPKVEDERNHGLHVTHDVVPHGSDRR